MAAESKPTAGNQPCLQGLASCLPCILALVATARLQVVKELAKGNHLQGAAGLRWPPCWPYGHAGSWAGHLAALKLPAEPTLHSADPSYPDSLEH